jgi:hypothetical protein
MRTFSLIWSGIGCFATVAIAVLGGVILTNTNTLRAADGDGVLFVQVLLPSDFLRLVLYHEGFHTSGYYHEQFSGFSLGNVGNSYWDSFLYYICDTFPLSGSITLKEGYKFDSTYYSNNAFVTAVVKFKDDYKTVDITYVADVRDISVGSFYLDSLGISYSYATDVILCCIESNDNEITSHISMDE